MHRLVFKCLAPSSVLLCMSVQARGEEGWPEAMVAFRERVLSPDKSLVTESVWHTTGPMRSDNLGVTFFPEKGVDPNAVDARGRKLWRPAPEYKNKSVNALRGFNKCVTYLYRTIRSAKPLELRIRMGSNYGLAAWHNGRMLLRGERERPPGPHDVRNVRLVPGENKVLLKVYNRSGKHAFYYDTTPFMNTRDYLWRTYGASNRIFERHFPNHRKWYTSNKTTELERAAIKRVLAEVPGSPALGTRLAGLIARRTPPASPEWLRLFEDSVRAFRERKALKATFAGKNPEAVKRALDDLLKTYPRAFRDSATLSRRAAGLVAAYGNAKSAMDRGDVRGVRSYMKRSADLQREILLRNPVLDFDRILLVKRKHDTNGSGDYFNFKKLGLPQNWQGNSSIPKNHDNEIASLRYKDASARIETVYKPKQNHFVGDVDLHFGAKKMLFSSIGTHGRWHIFEATVDGTGLRQVSAGSSNDIDNYDPMYLPDGRIIYDSSSGFHGVPCVGGHDPVANLHRMNADGTGVRRLCFDQDNDWCPTMLPNGRVLYLRWEYADIAHYFSRILFHMNPDGTNQSEFYGSNSYWPNSVFYARPFPGSSSKFVGIVGGHHGVPRMGELVLFNTGKGRSEASGVIQRIPGYGKPVKAVYRDGLVQDSWPKFLHPFPLGDPSVPKSVGKYFLVSSKPAPGANWGIYLVDVFDNMLLLKDMPGHALFEPVPLKKTPVPPVIPDRIVPGAKTATVYLQNIYSGDGLKGVPPGTVKSLRIVQYEHGFREMGGHFVIGMEGPWDVHCVLGTVPVFKDGSALFTIPANTPVAVQPLDAEGKAMQQMRSWFVGMPGEAVSCVGCHGRQSMAPMTRQAEASGHKPVAPKPWYGKTRGFSFLREVQPVLDRYCVGCHDNKKGRPNLADTELIDAAAQSRLPRSYLDLHPYVRRNGPEGDNYVLTPLEFHVNTSTLFRMLRKGHHNVKLDTESWDRLITWVDLNVPCHGTWHETRNSIPRNYRKRRHDLKQLYAGLSEDMESVPAKTASRPAFIKPKPMPPKPRAVKMAGWPLAAGEAARRQKALGNTAMSVDLGDGVRLELARVPAGEFVMGDVNGETDEYPTSRVRIKKPFWMGSGEITLREYRRFDPSHKNGFYDAHGKDQGGPGRSQDAWDGFPVIRVSWKQAMAFCDWLSKKTGRRVSLPTEAQWEWACRAGTDTPFYYGDINTNFGEYANLADQSMSELAWGSRNRWIDYLPKDARFNDGALHLTNPKKYKPNAWGLRSMIGNVAEWTRSVYKPYPYKAVESPDAAAGDVMVVRGGSWYDRPKHARVSCRLDYPSWQRVYNVGFRVVIED